MSLYSENVLFLDKAAIALVYAMGAKGDVHFEHNSGSIITFSKEFWFIHLALN